MAHSCTRLAQMLPTPQEARTTAVPAPASPHAAQPGRCTDLASQPTCSPGPTRASRRPRQAPRRGIDSGFVPLSGSFRERWRRPAVGPSPRDELARSEREGALSGLCRARVWKLSSCRTSQHRVPRTTQRRHRPSSHRGTSPSSPALCASGRGPAGVRHRQRQHAPRGH